jgi:osmotically inducible protein OsmC
MLAGLALRVVAAHIDNILHEKTEEQPKMPKAERNARVEWHGNLIQGSGTIVSTGSGAFGQLPVTWASRVESSDGKTSPEELLAAAQASCYAMQFSSNLAKAGYQPELLDVSATATFEPPKITTMKIDVRGRVPGLSDSEFKRIAAEAEQGCPVANALRNNVDLQVNAQLESQQATGSQDFAHPSEHGV